ncbi:S41 family peptidase [Bradyrhizobium sp. B117]|uniref:S41 family peptidase n=1 Tax=Bradyrhizobium sp. B117 TaxID=3140246 RepID=UPI0031843CC9
MHCTPYATARGSLTSEDTSESVAYACFVLSELKEGRGLRTKNTRPGFVGGIAEIAPAPNHYTKKVVVAVNEKSFSAAEFLAAIMQDNHQAIIIGQRTGGAGGLVRSVELSPDFKKAGISDFKLTWTLAWRSSGSPIEDLGVTPDIFYNITVDDLRSGYVGYREALLATAVKQ